MIKKPQKPVEGRDGVEEGDDAEFEKPTINAYQRSDNDACLVFIKQPALKS